MDNTPVTPQPKPFPLNTILLIITSASLLLTGFFIYQNQLLQRKLDQIVKTQTQVTPTPTATPTPTDDTANWQTYKNTKYNIEIKYPVGWTSLPQSSEYVRFFKGTYSPNIPTPQTYISITVNPNPSQEPLKEWLISQKIIPTNNNPATHIQVQEKEIILGGVRSVPSIWITTPTNGGQDTAYISMGNNIFETTYVFTGENPADNIILVDTFKQMLTTLAFPD